MSAVEQVVLLDEDGEAVGTAAKADVHHVETPLHLAFSCYLFDGSGRFLLTQRALDKKTFPGVWTNSCCGHPAPGEDVFETVRRRVGQELGVTLDDLRLVLPDFRYRAVMPDGVVENEMCPVFVATTSASVEADPEEVEAHEWVDWAEFRGSVLTGAREISHWCLLQVRALPADPRTAVGQSRDLLPPAAR
ncbi:Isopentenyl-diphosphate Delta-isomerase [metagenome]|uniref:isopentenyl-diphosphate Delta-isomerase n=1 Tax=metagenome TaxID=256318 RepID=A0A2P2CG02_9ZZZZ